LKISLSIYNIQTFFYLSNQLRFFSAFLQN